MEYKSRGLYFEDFKVGEEFVSAKRTITEHDIEEFAGLTGDYNPIHTDTVFAENSIFGERVAHGLLGLSIVSGLAARLGFTEETNIAWRSIKWKFKLPIKIMDTIQASYKVGRKKDLGENSGAINFVVKVTNQNGQIVQTGSWLILIKKRE
jgi:3-hydroxybutyryl-CoA dehydratase